MTKTTWTIQYFESILFFRTIEVKWKRIQKKRANCNSKECVERHVIQYLVVIIQMKWEKTNTVNMSFLPASRAIENGYFSLNSISTIFQCWNDITTTVIKWCPLSSRWMRVLKCVARVQMSTKSSYYLNTDGKTKCSHFPNWIFEWKEKNGIRYDDVCQSLFFAFFFSSISFSIGLFGMPTPDLSVLDSKHS